MKILIVDDEPIARARLRRLLDKHPNAEVEVVGEAGDGLEALDQIRALRPDVVLLDIDMPGLDGLAVAEDPDTPPVVFTTAHRDYALDAFDANAVDYLLKPVSRERLERALARARERQAPEHGERPVDEPWRVVVRDGSMRRFIDARQVDAFMADRKYVAFELEGQEFLCRESLDTLQRRLHTLGFLRVNRATLVRRDAITGYDGADGGTVEVRSGQRFAVSRRAAAAVREALGV